MANGLFFRLKLARANGKGEWVLAFSAGLRGRGPGQELPDQQRCRDVAFLEWHRADWPVAEALRLVSGVAATAAVPEVGFVDGLGEFSLVAV